jgi:DNA-directed RNA polymerase specialized sigma24 family protein
MRDPEDFDAFYKDARERLLAQTYAITGDLGASRKAVRDAFVVAWHHWRKISRHERPEDLVRPHAWRLAQRRHTARVWHREKNVPDDVHATLDALGKLSSAQRRALVLTQLASVSMEQMAREVGLPLEQAERELQTAAATLSLALDVETVRLREVFERLADSVSGGGRWPRTTIVRRQGAARRRAHTVLGAVGGVAAVLVTGSLVTSADGVQPTLDQVTAQLRVPTAPTSGQAPPDPMVEVLPQSTLLLTDDLADRYDDREWRLVRTGDNSAGNGLAFPCQQERYADPRGRATLVRYFEGTDADGGRTTAVQLTEASRSPKAARRAFRTTASWIAGCAEPRVQLLGTRVPREVGDEALQVVLRSWTAPVTTYVIGIARTGAFTTTTALTVPGAAVPDRQAAAGLLAAGVTRLCAEPTAGACAATTPAVDDVDPLPTGARPALLSELDLPPVTGVDQPWVGTQPVRPTTNAAATGCDRTSFAEPFQGSRFSRSATRTFLVPEADLPQEFGLTETVGALPARKAEAFVAQVRERVGSCEERDLNTEVDEVVRRDGRGSSLTAWRLDVRVSDDRAVVYYMAIVRVGTAVAQVGFVPGPQADLPDGAFVALAERARARLAEMPPPTG